LGFRFTLLKPKLQCAANDNADESKNAGPKIMRGRLSRALFPAYLESSPIKKFAPPTKAAGSDDSGSRTASIETYSHSHRASPR
jgi:hypothetical protein